MIRVLIADDHELVRAGFAVLVESADDLEVVGLAANGQQAVELARERLPDVVLMDIRMPVLDGLAATRRILRENPRIRVLVLTTFDLDEYVYAALKGGANGFLLKDTPPADLLAGIRVVARGEAMLSPSITRQLIEQYVVAASASASFTGSAPGRGGERLPTLTEREREVLALVARGLSNAEIAEALVISPTTAKTHVGRLLTKLDARDRAQLIVIAYENGIVTAHP
jgi:DNA-binding NarL/FixJ family response regulator